VTGSDASAIVQFGDTIPEMRSQNGRIAIRPAQPAFAFQGQHAVPKLNHPHMSPTPGNRNNLINQAQCLAMITCPDVVAAQLGTGGGSTYVELGILSAVATCSGA